MIITRIRAKNFRGCKDVDVSVSNSMLVVGLNGAGKSSLLDAIRMCLYGYCRHTTKSGAGAGNLVGGQANIQVDFSHEGVDGSAACRIEEAGKQTFTGTLGKAKTRDRAEMWDLLGIPLADAAVAGDGAAYMRSQSIADELGKRCTGAVDQIELKDLCGAQYNWLCETFLNRVETLSGLVALGKVAFDQRRDVRRDIKAADPGPEPDQPCRPDGDLLDRAHVSQIKEGLEALSGQRDALMQSIGKSKAAWEKADLAVVDAKTAKIAHDDAALAYNALCNERKEAEAAAKVSADAAQECFARLRATENEIASLKGKLEAVSEAVGTNPDVCPTCGRKWPASKAKAAAPARVEERESLRAKEKLLEFIQAEHQEKERAKIAARNERDKLNTAVGEASHTLSVAKLALEQSSSRQDEEKPQDIEPKIEALNERIARGQDTLKRLETWTKWQRESHDLETMLKEEKRLDWAVKAFKDGLVLNQLQSEGLESWQDAVNTALQGYGMACSFEADGKDIRVWLTVGDNKPQLIEDCSSGERKLAESAVAECFVPNGGVVLVDDLDKLDAGRKRALMGRIMQGKPTAQYIMSSCWNLPTPPDTEALSRALAPVKVVEIKGGTCHD